MARKTAAKSDSRKWRTLEAGDIHKWTKGMIVEGKLLEIREGNSDMFEKKGHIVDFKTADGVFTVGCPTILHNKLKQADIGDYVRIECEGKIKARRGQAWDFTVQVAVSEDTAEVGAE